MLQLLSPVGLWALASLALPLTIHLWRRPPRTVRLGSLRFLETLPRRLHDLRWRERALLASRLGLFALLALLVGGPRWQARPPRGPQHWALLDPTASPSGGSLERLRAQQAAGDETRWLAPGFPASDGTTPPAQAAPDLWSLLREADAELPAGSVLTVFSPGRLAALRGTRPALRHGRVEWVQTLDTPPPVNPPGRDNDHAPLPPVRVGIFHDPGREADARFIDAALRAAAEISGRAVEIRNGADVSNPLQGQWLVWLSAQPIPVGWTDHRANMLREAVRGNDDGSNPGWFVVPPEATGASAFLDPVRLWKRLTAPDDPTGAVCWTDGFGQPLLTMTRRGQGAEWTLFTRFDPAWTDLPQGSALPLFLRALIWNQGDPPPVDPVNDRRLADPSQCDPSETAPTGPDVTLSRADGHAVDLHGPLWTLAAVLFGLERFLSVRRRPPIITLTPEPARVAAVAR